MPPQDDPPHAEPRTLTDADVDAIVKAFRVQALEHFYSDLGKGVWALVQRAFILAVVAVAAYGVYKK